MFTIKKRLSLAVWVYSLKQVRQLRRYGMITYISKRMKYVVIYIDYDQADRVINALNNLRFVRLDEVSHRHEVNMSFGKKLDQAAASQSDGGNI